MYRLVLALLAASGAPAETLVNTDFAGAYQPAAGNANATGELPPRWSDNSSWARVWTTYSKRNENGRSFFRMEVTRIEDGNGQIQHPLPRWTATAYMRLRVALRATEGVSVGLGLRRSGSPYNYLWQTSQYFPNDWRDFTYYARIDPAAYDIGFYILLNAPGALDLSAFTLDRLTEAELIEELRTTSAAYPKNLLRNTRFPLGLQSGWSLDRDSSDGDDVLIDSDGTALHVQTDKLARIHSEPFPAPRPLEPYTASISVRGGGTFRLSVMNEGRVLGQASVTPSDEWKRVRATFTAPLLARTINLRMEVSGDIRVDFAQVEAGRDATGYASGGSCEIALGVDSVTRVQFEDEPAEVRYAVTGDCAAVRARVINLYDQEAAAKPANGTIRYDLFPQRPYGAFRVEVWGEDESGTRASPYNELVVFRLRRPRYWMDDAPDSPFGVHTNSTTRHILMAKAAGANWTRLHDAGLEYIGWYWLERKPSEWAFRDAEIYRYRDYGIKILGLLSTAPEWASYFEKAHNGYYDRFYQPRELDWYANYVRIVTRRYLGAIDTWDIWNEPWNAGWWAIGYDEQKQNYVTSANPQADFAKLQKTAYDAAKSVDPSLTILGINSTTGTTGANWTRGVVAAGGLDACEVIAYHQYTSGTVGLPGDSVETGRAIGLGPLLEDGAAPRPVWMTEGSAVQGAGALGPGFYHYTVPFEITENYSHTSDRLARFLVSHLAQGNRKMFLYSMHAHSSFSGAPSDWRALVSEDGYLHPTAAAHSALAWLLEDTRFVKTVTVREGITAYLFEGPGRSVAALSPAVRHGPYALPAAGADLFGNPLSKGAAAGSTIVYLPADKPASALEALLR